MIEPTNVYDITIIGAGPVGLFAAFYGGLRQAKVKVIDSLEVPGGQPAHLYPEKFIYDIPAYPKITGADLITSLSDQLKRFDVDFALGEEALDVEHFGTNHDGYFKIETNQAFHYSKTIIIAAGNGAFNPRKLKLDEASLYEKNNLHYYVRPLESYRDKVVAIAGGGDSAVDWALMLEPIAKEVYIIHRRDKFRAMEASVNRLMNSSVNILTPYVPKALAGEGSTLKRIILEKARSNETLELDVDTFIVNYGFSSSIGNIRKWNLETHHNMLTVNQKLETSTPGIFAIGDIAYYDGKVRIIATGFGEAPNAINNALHFINPDYITPAIHSSSLF